MIILSIITLLLVLFVPLLIGPLLIVGMLAVLLLSNLTFLDKYTETDSSDGRSQVREFGHTPLK